MKIYLQLFFKYIAINFFSSVKREKSTGDGLYYYLMDCINRVGEISESANYLTNLNIQKTWIAEPAANRFELTIQFQTIWNFEDLHIPRKYST